MALVCKNCGYKQYDIDTIKKARERFPDMSEHDIPYFCGACLDGSSDEEYESMMALMRREMPTENESDYRYVLMYCHEREMSVHGVFPAYEAAFETMKTEFRKYLVEEYEIDEEDVEALDRCLERDGEAYFSEFSLEKMSAWSNIDEDHRLDWQIAKIEI